MSIADFGLPSFIASLAPKLLLIDGEWTPSARGDVFESINPSNGKVLAKVARGTETDIDRAVGAARRAFGSWSKVKPADRQRILLRLADIVERSAEELSVIDSLDMGAPITRTRAAQRRWTTMIRYYAGLATAIQGDQIQNSLPGNYLSYTACEPIGVVGGITPWNGPMVTTIWKVVPALAAGCTVVLKPSEEACLSALRFGELAMEAGVPPGAVNIVPGFGDAGSALAIHPDVDKVCFTGSTETGQAILRASAGNFKRVTLELGGKSPDIVFADADLDKAVAGAAMAVFANSGQICSAGTRLFVERSIYDEFVHRVAEFGRGLKLGDSLDPTTDLGPLVSKRQLDRVCGYLDIAAAEGVHVLSGGGRLTQGALRDGFYLAPTVLTEVKDSMRIAREEIFGPVVVAFPFDDVDEVIARGNDTIFGLGSGVWTRNLSTAHRVAAGLRAGSVWVNCWQTQDPAIPFGGFKRSGIGRESGRNHIEAFLETKSVVVNLD